MENKRMAMLVVMMMLVTGSLLVETEAISFNVCYTGCSVVCGISAHGFKKWLCPFKCIKDCIHPKLSSEVNLKEIDQTDYFCKLGCATDRCISSSSIEDKDHAEKVSVCVDSCSDMCSHKN
ncbi:thionin-like protein 1 [Eutrema salsugineum]|uniref:thionin-like protein 1 n=1 Tax=Eutrema salsugineum TaxID=72664 RepID=UPI000CED1E3F|nr:thionin-like protein 1 [Eutrema salsugineum]